ncbi:Dcg1p KNAG_0D03100 [Huiozyma naganishii CBS 8797]|uniref:Protein DCG1 n=1 Tax=Huiozyma naganishii (strain ATCC MYA-139 / BCRC 22969 / CBS 8797 / KCTC 17520 / NBRC 10181 / NCYC 3082 / Yp74L-3) TaxID=1071383 RepID=J7RKN3_HUIN7|nr:hypothetical protein KNAG_0D03100 [Kazachstania naganishii CBS 8797]CCK70058.1 hypothetical protein KNAG_0D03100 [Kazachstania naganishii CBS 8797]
MSQIHILVVNPNSSESMTHEVEQNIRALFKKELNSKSLALTFATGPASAPLQIDGKESSLRSAEACLPMLTDAGSVYFYNKYDGVLVACFSDHPLVAELLSVIKSTTSKTVVMGLLDTSIHYCNMINSKPFSIITSNKEWVPILNESVESKYLTSSVINQSLWKGTISSDIQVLDLHLPENFAKIVDVIRKENIERLKSKIIILGCAGFSGLQTSLSKEFPGAGIVFVDSVAIGVRVVMMIADFNKSVSSP